MLAPKRKVRTQEKVARRREKTPNDVERWEEYLWNPMNKHKHIRPPLFHKKNYFISRSSASYCALNIHSWIIFLLTSDITRELAVNVLVSMRIWRKKSEKKFPYIFLVDEEKCGKIFFFSFILRFFFRGVAHKNILLQNLSL